MNEFVNCWKRANLSQQPGQVNFSRKLVFNRCKHTSTQTLSIHRNSHRKYFTHIQTTETLCWLLRRMNSVSSKSFGRHQVKLKCEVLHTKRKSHYNAVKERESEWEWMRNISNCWHIHTSEFYELHANYTENKFFQSILYHTDCM